MKAKHHPEYEHSDYLYSCLRLEEYQLRLPKAKAILKKYKFDAIAFRGMSGALVAAPLALAIKKTLIMVRKPEDEKARHSTRAVEGDRGAQSFVIVDDFVSSGTTMKTMLRAIKKFNPEAVCIGYLGWQRCQKRLTLNPIPSHWLAYVDQYDRYGCKRTIPKEEKIEEANLDLIQEKAKKQCGLVSEENPFKDAFVRSATPVGNGRV
jgi:adenine/guanine phosphoribosyltransferase-like PRPP-binding protein